MYSCWDKIQVFPWCWAPRSAITTKGAINTSSERTENQILDSSLSSSLMWGQQHFQGMHNSFCTSTLHSGLLNTSHFIHLGSSTNSHIHLSQLSFVLSSLRVSRSQESLHKKWLLATSNVCWDLAQALPVEQYERAELPVVLYLVQLTFVRATLNCYCCSCAPLP